MMKTGRILFSLFLVLSFGLIFGVSASGALDKKQESKLQACRLAGGDIEKVARTIRGRIESFENRLAEFKTPPFKQCKAACVKLEKAGNKLYFAITHADYKKLPNKAAGKKTRKAKDLVGSAYKAFGKDCKAVMKKEGWPEFKKLKAEYKKVGKACKGVSKIMGK
jgi:hypothetical protein